MHGNHPSKSNFQPLKNPGRAKVVHLEKVAHSVAVYPHATAHYFNQFPRLVYLILSLPKDVPILLANHRLRHELIDVMAKKGLVDPARIIDWDQNTVYYADSLYFAGEMGCSQRATGGIWDSLRIEHCSWAMALPRTTAQEMFTKDYIQARRGGGHRVVILGSAVEGVGCYVEQNWEFFSIF